MKIVNKHLETVLRSAITESLKNYEQASEGDFLGGLYLCYNADNQTLTFFDDLEKELFLLALHETPVAWEYHPLQEIKNTIRYVFKGLREERFFDKEFISKPFTVSLVNSDFVPEETLFFIDDHSMKSGGDLWSGINKELDEFLKQLMK